MKLLSQILIVLLFTAPGCATDLSTQRPTDSISFAPTRSPSTNETQTIENSAEPSKTITQVPLDPTKDDENGSPSTSKNQLDDSVKTSSLPLRSTNAPDIDLNYAARQWQGITRAQIRDQALCSHPAVAQAQANYDALKGERLQAGLSPNPTAGIVGSDINEFGGAGRYGVFFGREIVRGNKLAASENVVDAQLESAGHRLEIIKRRLLTDVDQFYYEVLIAQEQLALAQQLEKISQRAVEISQSLYKSQEIPKASVLQTQLQLQKAQLAIRRFEAAHVSATRKLAAIIGQEQLPTQYVAGNVRALDAVEDFEAAYDQLLRDSPELSKLFADIETKKRQLIRDQLEPISNVTWQTSFVYDFVSDDIVGGFQVGWEIPTVDKNQGAIYESSQRVVAAQRRVETKALELRRRLADSYQQYLDAQIQVQAYQEKILPIANETVQLLMKGYEAGEIEVLELLVAQRTLFQSQLSYLQNLRTLWLQTAAIEGLLLDDGLADQ